MQTWQCSERGFFQILLIFLLLALLTSTVFAVDIGGITVPETNEVACQIVTLNGAGIRKKFIYRIYVGALYLPERTSTANEAIAMPGPKRVTMTFLYKEITAKDITEGWNKGFQRNHSLEEMNALSGRLVSFNSMFKDIKQGDTIVFEYVPGTGTLTIINDTLKGITEGEDFFQGLLKVWLGENPADKGLKKAMLGQ